MTEDLDKQVVEEAIQFIKKAAEEGRTVEQSLDDFLKYHKLPGVTQKMEKLRAEIEARTRPAEEEAKQALQELRRIAGVKKK